MTPTFTDLTLNYNATQGKVLEGRDQLSCAKINVIIKLALFI